MKSNTLIKELPLIVFSLLLGITTGLYFAIFITYSIRGPFAFKGIYLTIFFLSSLALLFSIYHVRNKKIAYKSINNLKHSWLSREIFFFILFSLDTFLVYITYETHLPNIFFIHTGLILAFLSLFSSSMIYKIRHFKNWNTPFTVIRPVISSLLFCSIFLLLIGSYSQLENKYFYLDSFIVLFLCILLVDLSLSAIFEYRIRFGNHRLLKLIRLLIQYALPVIIIFFTDFTNYLVYFFILIIIITGNLIERISFFLENAPDSIETEIDIIKKKYMQL